MTVQAITWVLDESTSEARTRCVAIALANRFDSREPFRCWPGMPVVAREAKMSVRTAQRCIDELVFELQELIVVRNAGGDRVREDQRPNLFIFPAMLTREQLHTTLAALAAEFPRDQFLIGSNWSDCFPTGCQIDTPPPEGALDAADQTATGCQIDTPSTARGVTEKRARGDRTSARGVTELFERGDTVVTRSDIDPTVDPTGPLASGSADRRGSRGRDEIWEATLTVCGLSGSTPTSTERGAWNRAVHDLRAVEATVEEIHRRARAFRSRWPGATLTPSALARRWNEVVASTDPAAALDLSGVEEFPDCGQCGNSRWIDSPAEPGRVIRCVCTQQVALSGERQQPIGAHASR